MEPEELHGIGDLVKLHESLFYSYAIDEPFKKASPSSAYYAIGMKSYMVGIIVHVFNHEDLIDPDLWLPYNFVYKVWWAGSVGYRREQHDDLVLISKA